MATQQGSVVTAERQTVDRYLQDWLKHKESRLRPRAFATYQQAVDLHLSPGIGRVTPAKLSPQQIDRWFHEHRTASASARTIGYARAVLRAALNQALRWGLVTRNAAALVEPPRHVAREIQPLTPEQARTLLNYARNLCAHHSRLWNRTLAIKPLLPTHDPRWHGATRCQMIACSSC